MSNLPGNPHHNVAESVKREYGLTADKEALNWPLAEMNERLVALAYEQRTANLIALALLTNPNMSPDCDMESIYNRLGLGENK